MGVAALNFPLQSGSEWGFLRSSYHHASTLAYFFRSQLGDMTKYSLPFFGVFHYFRISCVRTFLGKAFFSTYRLCNFLGIVVVEFFSFLMFFSLSCNLLFLFFFSYSDSLIFSFSFQKVIFVAISLSWFLSSSANN